jgi:epoxyqueuosine reductase
MQHHLQEWATERGCQIAWGSGSVVVDAKAEIAMLATAGRLDSEFFSSDLAAEVAPEEPRPGRSVVMIATPSPAHRVTFNLRASGGGKLEAILPPTYFRYQTSAEDIRQDLALHGLPGSKVDHLHGPHKAIAARLGLVRYGKNNLTYAPGLGSYLRLRGYWTDAELPASNVLAGPALLPECEGCEKCRKACPTGAIGSDRLLLRAQRCLTRANENLGDWPDWAASARHHCLVGCLLCQRVCPANPPLPVEDSGLEFSAEETKALLEHPQSPTPGLEASIRHKLTWLGPVYLEKALGRNLAALVRSMPAASSSAPPARNDSIRA